METSTGSNEMLFPGLFLFFFFQHPAALVHHVHCTSSECNDKQVFTCDHVQLPISFQVQHLKIDWKNFLDLKMKTLRVAQLDHSADANLE
jgi:hypothetical protein